MQPLEDLSQRRSGIRVPEDPADFDLRRERLENLQRSTRRQGRSLLETALATIPEREVRARAEIELALADWLQWHGSTREARKRYEALWASLSDLGEEELIGAWFSDPIPLPANDSFTVEMPELSPEIAMSLDVTEYGRAKATNGEINAALARSAGRLRRLLAATRFRPVIRNGQAVPHRKDRTLWRLVES